MKPIRLANAFMITLMLSASPSIAEDLGTAVETAAVPEIQAELIEAPPAEETPVAVAVLEDVAPAAPEEAPSVPEQAPPSSEQAGLPFVILSGLDAYALEGPESAIKTWIRGGPNESDSTLPMLTETFKEVENRYGRYIGYEVISIKTITPNSKLIYLQMNYEKGPFFSRFLCYRHAGAWVVSGRLAFDTDPQKILAP